MWQRHLKLDTENGGEGIFTPKLWWYLALAIIIPSLAMGGFFLFSLEKKYQHVYYPGVSVDGVAIEKLNPQEVAEMLQVRFSKQISTQLLEVVASTPSGEVRVATPAATLNPQLVAEPSLTAAFGVGHDDPWWKRVWMLITPQSQTHNFSTTTVIESEELKGIIAVLRQKLNSPGEIPTATLGQTNTPSSLKINRGKTGFALDEEATIDRITTATSRLNDSTPLAPIRAEVTFLNHELSDEEVASSSERAKRLIGKKITWQTSTTDKTAERDMVKGSLDDRELISLLLLPSGISATRSAALIEKVSKRTNHMVKEPTLDLDQNSLIVRSFTPPRNGLSLNQDDSQHILREGMNTLESGDAKSIEISLPINVTHPKHMLSETNSLGIKELVGFGESFYAHSIPNRIHNVALTATKVNNVVVKPGEEFSFNKTLGDVSAETGFRQAYVIRNGRTELGDGGGVCQVSTTVFRAALNAGLPITRRIPHSYRVSYYELNAKPGIDATVYAGNTDLRFINDTPGSILIHTETDSKNLHMTVEMFGTSDGRTAQIIDHKTWGLIPAPSPLYQDDPSLPQGTTKQIDFAAAGIHASFKNEVKDRSGKLIRTDEFVSNYKPWQAVFLRGTGPR